jgi:transposase
MTKAAKPTRAPRLPVHKPTSKAATHVDSDRPVGRPKVELAPRLRNSIAAALRKVPNINKTVAAMAKKGYEVSAGKVREVATAEGIELARNVRLQQAPAVLKLAVQLRSKHWSASIIASEIEEQLGVKVSPHYVNTLIRKHAASLARRAAK